MPEGPAGAFPSVANWRPVGGGGVLRSVVLAAGAAEVLASEHRGVGSKKVSPHVLAASNSIGSASWALSWLDNGL